MHVMRASQCHRHYHYHHRHFSARGQLRSVPAPGSVSAPGSAPSRAFSFFGASAFTLEEPPNVLPQSVPSRPRVWEEVFSASVLQAVTAEAHHYGVSVREEANRDKLPIESQVTRWMDADATPRCAIEVAVQQLRRLVGIDDEVGGEKGERRFVGAEWWVQRRPVSHSLDFHFDIDSCLMHSEKTMRSPDISSIFYLTTIGGPTVVLDQRCAEGVLWGHRLRPESATCADLIFPRPNQFTIFSGTCLHGVMPDIRTKSEDTNTEGEEVRNGREIEDDLRLTLLVNWWWEKKPLEPCCAPVSDALATTLQSSHTLCTEPPPFLPPPVPPKECPVVDLNLQTYSSPVMAVEGYLSLHGTSVPYDFFVPDEASATWQQRINTRVLELDHVRRINTALHA